MSRVDRYQDTDALGKAIPFAMRAHSGQRDKRGKPYILHLLRVMYAVSVPARCVAVLHDVVEDTHFSLTEVHALTGIRCDEAEALDLLTRPATLTYGEYIERLVGASGKPGRLAREVKVADLHDNLSHLTPELESLRRRYRMALERLS